MVARPLGPEAVLKRWLVRAAQLALTVAVTWFIVDRVGLQLSALGAVEADVWIPEPLLLGASVALLVGGYFMSGALWGLIVRDLGGPGIGLGTSLRLFMIANLGRYVPGKLWQIAGLAALAKGRGVPVLTATAAAVLGQGLALVAAAAVGMGAFLTGPAPYRRWGLVGAVLMAILVVLIAIPRVFRSLARGWFRITGTELPDALGSRHAVAWLALYAVNWLLYAFSFWVLVRSLGFGGDLVPVASAFAAAYVLGYVLVFAPAGLGPREGFLIMFLTPHLGATSAGVIAVVARVWTTLVELLPAGVFWIRHVAREREPEAGP